MADILEICIPSQVAVPACHLLYGVFPPINISLKLKHGDHGCVLRHPPVKFWEKYATKVTFHQPDDFKVVEEVHSGISHNYFLWLNTTKGEKQFLQETRGTWEHVLQDFGVGVELGIRIHQYQ